MKSDSYDSLIIDGKIELLGGGIPSALPECAGAVFRLGEGYDLGIGQPAQDQAAAMLLDGERPLGDRTSNRTMSLPVLVRGTSQANLGAARETLLKLVDQPTFTLTYRRNGFPAPHDALGDFADGTLAGFSPYMCNAAVRRRNYVTGDDSTFDTSIGHWVGGGPAPQCTLSRSIYQGHGGSAACLMMTSQAAGMMMAWPAGTPAGANCYYPCVPGESVTASAYFRATTQPQDCLMGIAFTDAAGAWQQNINSGPLTNSVYGWTRVTLNTTVPAGCYRAYPGPVIATTLAAGEQHYVDDVTCGPLMMDDGPSDNAALLTYDGSHGVGHLNGPQLPCVPGNWYEALAWICCPQGAPGPLGGAIGLDWWDASPRYLGQSVLPSGAVLQAGVWHLVSTGPQQAPDEAATMSRWAGFTGLGAGGQQFYVAGLVSRDAPGDPLVFDCFRNAAPQPNYSTKRDRSADHANTVTVNFQAAPFGRSDITEQISFASPVTGTTAPPSPLLIEGFESGYPAGWASTTAHRQGTLAAQYTAWPNVTSLRAGGYQAAKYVKAGGPWDLTPYSTLSGWLGLAWLPPQAGFLSGLSGHQWWSVHLAFTLWDSAGRKISMSRTVKAQVGRKLTAPAWTIYSVPLPYPGVFNYAKVVRWQVIISDDANPYWHVAANPGRLTKVVPVLDGLYAKPVSERRIASTRGAVYALFAEGSARAPLAVMATQPGGAAYKTLLLHRPSRFTPLTLGPCTPVGSGADPPDGAHWYEIARTDPDLPAGFQGTYTVILVAQGYDTPSAGRTVTVTFRQYAYAGAAAHTATASAWITPSSDTLNGVTWLNDITLPLLDLPPENVSAYTQVAVTSSNPADRFLDVLLIDTQGSTVLINTSVGAEQYYVDPPSADRDWGRVLYSHLDREQAESAMLVATCSGPPLTIEPADTQLLAYSVEGAPALAASYVPRWRLDRFDG